MRIESVEFPLVQRRARLHVIPDELEDGSVEIVGSRFDRDIDLSS